MLKTINSDQRRHLRFTAKQGAMALSLHFCGQITDISPGGIAIQGIWENNLPAEFSMTILTEDQQFYVPEIPVKRSWCTVIPPSEFSTIITKKAGLQFQDMENAEEIKQELARFIQDFRKPDA